MSACATCLDTGYIEVDGCTCGAGPALGIPGVGHEPMCGTGPCPDGCWDRLHPPVQDQHREDIPA